MLRSLILSFFLFAGITNSHAILTIDITQGTETALPIAVVPFAWQGATPAPPEDIAAIVRNDLERSGLFAALMPAAFPAIPVTAEQVNFDQWRMSGSRNLVIGRMSVAENGNYNVEFELFGILKGERLTGYKFLAPAATLRRTAHQISDLVYETLLNIPGAFNTRIAYVTLEKKPARKNFVYRLQIADADGAGGQTVLTSNEPILSPAWSPDGKSLSYVSFENKRTAVYVQDVESGQRDQVAAWKGLNTAPAWSPEGSRLALSLSKDGNPEIYILNLADRHLLRLTHNPAIDTEPSWSPDGQHLVFTSDRGGKPQIYRIASTGGEAQRLTFEGGYNARASYSPDGSKLVFLNGDNGAYRIALMNANGSGMRILTATTLDESPCFAPNGSMIIYATGKELAAVSVDGRVRQRLAVEVGREVREPAWSPLLVR